MNTLFIIASKSSIKVNKNHLANKIFQIPKLNRIHIAYLKGYSGPCQISKKKLFAQIVNDLKPFAICVKSSISDV